MTDGPVSGDGMGGICGLLQGQMHAGEWINVVSAVTAAAAGDARQIRFEGHQAFTRGSTYRYLRPLDRHQHSFIHLGVSHLTYMYFPTHRGALLL